mmetsp:Transcript_6547/g.9222  ORF Transcript_6547/g.9222 Transcript_6547/m.9222 type:complete len:917 (-) Transcript_6547:64-2814(-)
MSRFFGAQETPSASEASEDENERTNVVRTQLADIDSSSDDEDKRVVRTEKDKRYEALRKKIQLMRNFITNNNWNDCAYHYEEWKKLLEKTKNVFKKEGGRPDFVLIEWAYLQKVVSEKKQLQKEKKGVKLSKTDSKSLNKLNQRITKEITGYKAEIAALEKAGRLVLPVTVAEQKDDDGDDGDDGGVDDGVDDGDAGDDGDGEGGDDMGDDDWDDDYGDGDDDEDDSDLDVDETPGGFTRAFWLKKTPTEGDTGKKRDRKQREPKKKKEDTTSTADDGKKPEEKKSTEMSTEAVLKKLRDIEDTRGRRGVDRKEYIQDLELLLTKARKRATRVKIETLLTTALFDMNLNTGTALSINSWTRCAKLLNAIVACLLDPEMKVRLIEDDDDLEENYEELELEEEEKEKKLKEGKKADAKPAAAAARSGDEIIYIKGNLHSYIQRLSDQFLASLREMQEHDEKYAERLGDEKGLVDLIKSGTKYYQSLNKKALVDMCRLLHLTHTYYIYKASKDHFAQNIEEEKGYMMQMKSMFSDQAGDIVYDLCLQLYQAEGARTKTVARLCHVYYYCIHNRFHEARNLLLMSHLQDVIHDADIHCRILYNRTLAQLGLCAFRNGHFRYAMDCLSELFNHQLRIKELLAQGVTSNRYHHDRNLEKELREKMRVYPYHMHMAHEMLEAVNLISGMLIEIPNLAKGKRKTISRSFRMKYDPYKKQEVTAPPESTRQIILAASDILSNGDWEGCFNLICQLRMWGYMPHAQQVKLNLKKQIQQVALQIYLLVNASTYVSINAAFLCEMFSMAESDVHRIVSRMMLKNELLGAWDQPSGCIIMHNEEQSRLQQKISAMADKVAQHVEMNETKLDIHRYGWNYNRNQNYGKDSKGQRSHHRYNKDKSRGGKDDSNYQDRRGGYGRSSNYKRRY